MRERWHGAAAGRAGWPAVAAGCSSAAGPGPAPAGAGTGAAASRARRRCRRIRFPATARPDPWGGPPAPRRAERRRQAASGCARLAVPDISAALVPAGERTSWSCTAAIRATATSSAAGCGGCPRIGPQMEAILVRHGLPRRAGVRGHDRERFHRGRPVQPRGRRLLAIQERRRPRLRPGGQLLGRRAPRSRRRAPPPPPSTWAICTSASAPGSWRWPATTPASFASRPRSPATTPTTSGPSASSRRGCPGRPPSTSPRCWRWPSSSATGPPSAWTTSPG